MSTLNNLNYLALKFNEDTALLIEEICEPLFKYFGFTNFGYVKIDTSGKMLRVSTGLEWTKRYFDAQYYNDMDFYSFDDIPINGSACRIHTNQPKSGVYSELFDYNIWNIYTIYEKDIHYRHVYFFATSKENTPILDFYINKGIVLETFIAYFKERAAPWLVMNKSERLIKTQLQIHQTKAQEKASNIQQFLNDIESYIGKKSDELTIREKECAKLLMEGYTSKETSRILQVSPRTVEFHIDKLKRKLKCHNKAQLIKTLIEYID
jgi:LuxR family quorum-sensing system transcriptional regulator SolR